VVFLDELEQGWEVLLSGADEGGPVGRGVVDAVDQGERGRRILGSAGVGVVSTLVILRCGEAGRRGYAEPPAEVPDLAEQGSYSIAVVCDAPGDVGAVVGLGSAPFGEVVEGDPVVAVVHAGEPDVVRADMAHAAEPASVRRAVECWVRRFLVRPGLAVLGDPPPAAQCGPVVVRRNAVSPRLR
jgi:hypothetical protein